MGFGLRLASPEKKAAGEERRNSETKTKRRRKYRDFVHADVKNQLDLIKRRGTATEATAGSRSLKPWDLKIRAKLTMVGQMELSRLCGLSLLNLPKPTY
ncbi:hypothetical protein GUJ93_ZPchr0011g28801 [Zizania palustris]|uniref:Uncharacterized protein n=1 Tax=Zizania palustris TaxID=103762 RepID=A0A8J5WHP3_ZIZPA|nr:hypothetical protein GUJ93_ZPchr0011g28801 [Zizania palustris]